MSTASSNAPSTLIGRLRTFETILASLSTRFSLLMMHVVYHGPDNLLSTNRSSPALITCTNAVANHSNSVGNCARAWKLELSFLNQFTRRCAAAQGRVFNSFSPLQRADGNCCTALFPRPILPQRVPRVVTRSPPGLFKVVEWLPIYF